MCFCEIVVDRVKRGVTVLKFRWFSFVFHLSGWILVVSVHIEQFCLLFWTPKVHLEDIFIDETFWN